jgi:DDE superfamily endonuclease
LDWRELQFSLYVRFGRQILGKVLSAEEDAAIKVPTDEKIEEYKSAILARHNLLHDVWCSMDGLKLKIQRPPDNNTQNNFYNGWTHDHYVSGVFVFAPDGTIPICCFNMPGCMHDSKIAEVGNVYKKLERVYILTGGKCTADSAFSSKKPFILKTGVVIARDRNSFVQDVLLQQQTTSMRQTAEWGMRGLQASFPRLKDRIIYEEHGERKLMMKVCILLHNLRARRVGISQIRNVYMDHLNTNAEQYFTTALEQNLQS